MTARFTSEELLDCVRREIKLRRRVYPRRVEQGHMTQRLATDQIAMMEAVAEIIEPLAAGERLL